MNRGKNICSQLKAIRRTIADENDIHLEIPECTFKGNCSGTCPQCESEVRFLENELAKRLSLGKAATVAGIALALATPVAAQEVGAKDTVSVPAIELKDTLATSYTYFCIIDQKSKEPIPLANVSFVDKDGNTIIARQTDFDFGRCKVADTILAQTHEIHISAVGYLTTIMPLSQFPPLKKDEPNEIYLVTQIIQEVMMGIPVEKDPIIDHCASGLISTIERDGLKVKVQY